jgi:hypothetical protein
MEKIINATTAAEIIAEAAENTDVKISPVVVVDTAEKFWQLVSELRALGCEGDANDLWGQCTATFYDFCVRGPKIEHDIDSVEF